MKGEAEAVNLLRITSETKRVRKKLGVFGQEFEYDWKAQEQEISEGEEMS